MSKVVPLLTVLLFSACTYNNPVTEIAPGTNYLPLEVGNSWDFQSIGSNQTTVHREVTGTTTINGRQYYLLVTTSVYSTQTVKDSAYYRIDSNNSVFIYRTSEPNFEENRFRLDANHGDSWTYPIDSTSTAKITVTLSSLQLGNVEIQNCKNYYYDVINWADEEYTITLAPGIGFAKEYSNAWGIGQVLKSVKIHGQVYNF